MGARITAWVTRAATSRLAPAPKLGNREEVLAAVLHPARLPTMQAVAVKVVEVASRPDCRPEEIVAMVAQDPGLCAELLRGVNSARTGLTKQIGSLDRAILLVGLKRVRAIALGLSLPAMKPQCRYDRGALGHSLSSVGGAIFARELATRLGYPRPEDEVTPGLLRDVGVLLLQQTFPAEWEGLQARPAVDPYSDEECEREREVFGIDHAEVGAEVLHRWGLPDEVVEPIRYHHARGKLDGTPHAARGELLWFAGMLSHLDTLVEHPDSLDRVLTVAEERFALPRPALAVFLDEVRPKIDQFAQSLDREIGRCPNYAKILDEGSAELLRLGATHG